VSTAGADADPVLLRPTVDQAALASALTGGDNRAVIRRIWRPLAGAVLFIAAGCSGATGPSEPTTVTQPPSSSGSVPVMLQSASPSAATASSGQPRLLGVEVSEDLARAILTLADADGYAVVTDQQRIPVVAGAVSVPLALAEAAEVQRRAFDLISPLGIRAGALTVEYYSAAYYGTVGVTNGGVILVFTSIARVPLAALPTDAEWQDPPLPEQARPKDGPWTSLLATGASGSSQGVREATTAFFASMDAMNVAEGRSLCGEDWPALRTWQGLVDGSCYVACVGLSRTLVETLRATGHPARTIALQASVNQLPNGVLVQTSEQHTTAEVYEDGRWRWIDPTFRVMAVRNALGLALSLPEVLVALADPSARSGLVFDLVEPGSTRARSMAMNEVSSEFELSLERYLTLDKTLLLLPEPVEPQGTE
jgi:hypothetical protein